MTRSFASYQQKASTMKQSHLRDMFKRPSRVTVHELLWLSPDTSVSYSINFFNYDDSRKRRRGPR